MKIKIKFFSIVFLALMNTNSFAQNAPENPEAKSSSSKVVEIETDIGVEQLKPSPSVSKPGIKPRVNYVDKPGAKKIEPQKREVSPRFTEKNSSAESAVSKSRSSESVSEGEDLSDDALPSLPAKGNSDQDKEIVDEVKAPKETITDKQVVEISSSLRNLIEENERLKNEMDSLDQQLKTVRGQQKLESNRMNEISLERDALKKQNANIAAEGSKTQQSLTKLQEDLTQKENDYNLRIVQMQTELANALRANGPVQPQEQAQSQAQAQLPTRTGDAPDKLAAVVPPKMRSISVDVVSRAEEVQKRGEKVLMDLDTVTKETQKLMKDEAKVHYNMGNTYFNQGDYQRAGAEYARAVDLMPDDASAHYNLAFVSQEFLNDPQSAAEHYKKYLYLNPGAEDAVMVRQKVIEAEIIIKGDIHFNSKLNNDLKKKKNEAGDTSNF